MRVEWLILLALVPACAALGGDAFGHGSGSEILPPVPLGDKMVTLEVSTSRESEGEPLRVSISLIDFDAGVTLRDVILTIRSEHAGQLLFEQRFEAPSGFIVFELISENADSVMIEADEERDFFGSLLGLESNKIVVRGQDLAEGGLYKFHVAVSAAEGKAVEPQLVFDSAVSVAQTTAHRITDPNFGEQDILVITYYDEISDFAYEPAARRISYLMPFEWNRYNVDQTQVVHQEISIPKEFGDLLASGFVMEVNGVRMPQEIVAVDDFVEMQRVVHFTVPQSELYGMLEDNEGDNMMEFVIRPDRDYPHLSAVTINGQFRILVSWEPLGLPSGREATVSFDITDVFLRNRPVSTEYELSVTQGDRTIFEQSGTSSGSREEHDTARFIIPQDVSGVMYLNFGNLAGNDLASATIPVAVNREPGNAPIPGWIKVNAAWWAEGRISDAEFVAGIEYLIRNKVINVRQDPSDSSSEKIPSWVKSNAAWWAEGRIGDDAFVGGLEYLIRQGIIRI